MDRDGIDKHEDEWRPANRIKSLKWEARGDILAFKIENFANIFLWFDALEVEFHIHDLTREDCEKIKQAMDERLDNWGDE